MRRLQQKVGVINPDEVTEFWRKAEERFPAFENKWGNVIEFIIKNSPVDRGRRY
ncbi:hypothetical protein HY946_02040 [Candidatus Gottesmanbacteria bacterium]|nr:hypothetical protein [Candidatus Gottesmanbacteria bacterium]